MRRGVENSSEWPPRDVTHDPLPSHHESPWTPQENISVLFRARSVNTPAFVTFCLVQTKFFIVPPLKTRSKVLPRLKNTGKFISSPRVERSNS
ncbi:hypothetical protein GE061_003261 [Apolygus lucorum]|uniref:Uncharacterized protein n=1 Tax=Apolygus lucorum TaxID=248454 RepID=A0A8S9X436_APOLU|nr:hypothetical protein GE061_003261 [Apolygus lucorum]